jgi:flagellar biosynthetic protein FliR
MQPIALNAAELSEWVTRMWWPVLRIGGFVVTAPIVSSGMVPGRIKILLTIGLAFLFSPMIRVPAGLSIFSAAGMFAAVQELLIGAAIGMVVQLAFEAFTFAGQTISMTMGLGFATLVDPQRGAQTTVIGQLFTVFATLTYLAVNGHLVLFGALADSFQSLPIGGANLKSDFLWSVAGWGGRIFETGLLIALPAVVSLLIVNLALGVITRAAPQLNLFGVGFPITMLGGYFVLMVGLDGLMVGISSVLHGALTAVVELVSVRAAGVP